MRTQRLHVDENAMGPKAYQDHLFGGTSVLSNDMNPCAPLQDSGHKGTTHTIHNREVDVRCPDMCASVTHAELRTGF